MPEKVETLVTDLTQVCVVVHDLEATMRSYAELAGIGPWAVYEFAPPDVTDIYLRGRPVECTARIALAFMGEQMWEIIQPVEGPSIFREFLDEYGEGMQHILVKHAGHKVDDVVARFASEGCPVMMSMIYRGTRFAYLDARKPLKMVLEIFERPPEAAGVTGRPATEPAFWYPHAPNR